MKDQNCYIGTTKDLEKRLNQHNSGLVKSTIHRKPFIIVYNEEFKTLSQARKREWFLKCTPQGGKFKKKILDNAGVAARRA